MTDEENDALFTQVEAQRDPEFLYEADEERDYSEEQEYDNNYCNNLEYGNSRHEEGRAD